MKNRRIDYNSGYPKLVVIPVNSYKKMILNMGVGTADNPIKLVPENIDRPLRNKFSSVPVDKTVGMKSLKPEDDPEIFILNVLANMHLTRNEISVVLYFFYKRFDVSKLFLTIDPKANFKPEKHFGDGTIIHIGRPDTVNHDECHLDECRYLISELAKLNIKLTSSRLVHILGNLHDFGYITITEISLFSTYEGCKIKNQEKTRSKLRHIRLSEEMQKKDITKKWYRKLKREKHKKLKV